MIILNLDSDTRIYALNPIYALSASFVFICFIFPKLQHRTIFIGNDF